jgi:hypothetical protein
VAKRKRKSKKKSRAKGKFVSAKQARWMWAHGQRTRKADWPKARR